jgi:CheY-like chemotaxis protein
MGGDIVYSGEDDLICRLRIWLKKAPLTVDINAPPETPIITNPFLEEELDSSGKMQKNDDLSKKKKIICWLFSLRFLMLLLYIDYSDDNSTQSSSHQSAPVSNKEIRILIVDSLSVVVDGIATYLRTVPRYTCQTTTSISEAVKLITNSFETKTPFDLILLDFKQETLGRFMMQSHPKMFKRTKWVPILFSQDNYKLNNVEWEWTSAIYKPIRMNSLLETVSLTLMGLDNTAGYPMREIKRSDAKV